MQNVKLGVGIGCGIGGMILAYFGMTMVWVEGMMMIPTLMALSGVALIILAVMFFKQAECLDIPMPPAARQALAPSAKASPAKKATARKKAKAGKKKRKR